VSPSAPRPIPTYDGAWNLGARFGISDSDAQLLYFAGSILLALVLAAITGYYARQNRRMADHNARMVDEMSRQTQLAQWDRRARVHLRGRRDGSPVCDGRLHNGEIPGVSFAQSAASVPALPISHRRTPAPADWKCRHDPSRLYDVKRDPRKASLTTLITRVNELPPAKRGPGFAPAVPGVQADIKAAEKILAPWRNAFWAHRDLTKILSGNLRWADLSGFIERAKEIAQACAIAAGRTPVSFRLLEAEREPVQFLEWCRLDNYEKHFQDHMARWKRRIRAEARRAEKRRN